ncbi:MAG: MarR family winged helix-turn-helix transcriptional regulator [Acidimicrobiales bacterium]
MARDSPEWHRTGRPVPVTPLPESVRLRAALMKIGQRLRAIDAGTGFTPTELSMLGTVVRTGPLQPTELARAEGCNPTMTSRIVGRLVLDGALARRANPGDRRTALVVATARGRRIHERLRSERVRALEHLIGHLPEDDRDAIVAAIPALEALAELMKAQRP